MIKIFQKKSDNKITIEDIHNEFFTASDKLLKEVTKIILDTSINEDKIARLQKLGFNKSIEVTNNSPLLNKIKRSKETCDLINEYKTLYPYKFIAFEQVDEICKKYNLVTGLIENYKGFVPEKNLKDIEQSQYYRITKLKQSHTQRKKEILIKISDLRDKHKTPKILEFFDYLIDKQLDISGVSSFGSLIEFRLDKIHKDKNDVSWNYVSENGRSLYNILKDSDFRYTIETATLYSSSDLIIAAPEKDMDTTGLTKIKNSWFSTSKRHYPDPVVMIPVKMGYLIVTAWGDEASDPLVFNEKQN